MQPLRVGPHAGSSVPTPSGASPQSATPPKPVWVTADPTRAQSRSHLGFPGTALERPFRLLHPLCHPCGPSARKTGPHCTQQSWTRHRVSQGPHQMPDSGPWESPAVQVHLARSTLKALTTFPSLHWAPIAKAATDTNSVGAGVCVSLLFEDNRCSPLCTSLSLIPSGSRQAGAQS